MSGATILDRGRRVLGLERAAIAELERRLDDRFVRAVEMLEAKAPEGRVIVAGVGKTGLIGRKIAATLTSTGTPAIFLHPVESLHGDLGLVGKMDVAILVSKSGTTDELLTLVEHLKRLGVGIIALTGAMDSPLARYADVALDTSVGVEACPHDLAPTTSTTAALALGDALAVALLEQKGFKREDFALLHPGGALGRRLIVRVRDVMLTRDLPILPGRATMRDAVPQLAERRGIVMVAESGGPLEGLITTGDLTRLMERDEQFLSVTIGSIMTKQPKTATADELGSAVVHRMEQHGKIAMPVLDDGRRIIGVVHLHDLMRAGAG
jgi:arabinose-5-phosphate isomerase